ncbi:MAG: PqqD family peptide modification chaperone [Acidobacteria bacterium]|nr:PqqD family peptide modification chaperone [Acidobacteriota bacterium]
MSEPRVIRISDPLPAVLPKRRKGLEVAEFEAELVVLDTASKQAHHLDGLASIVFDACDGRTRSQELIRQVAEATGSEPTAVASEVTELWRSFVRLGLVVVQARSSR